MIDSDPITQFFADNAEMFESNHKKAADAIIQSPIAFAEALRSAGFVFVYFDLPEPSHVHEWELESASRIAKQVYWRCVCGASATTYALVPES